MDYEFDSFLNIVKHLDLDDVIASANARYKQLQKGWGKPNKKDALILSDKIQAMIDLLKTGKRPEHVTDFDLQKLKPVCENLVAKKQIPPEVLKIFEK